MTKDKWDSNETSFKYSFALQSLTLVCSFPKLSRIFSSIVGKRNVEGSASAALGLHETKQHQASQSLKNCSIATKLVSLHGENICTTVLIPPATNRFSICQPSR